MISWMTKRRLLEGLLFAAAGTGAAINVVQFHKHGFALGWSNIWSMPAMAVWDGLALYRFRRKALARRQPGQAPARFYAVSVRGLTALAALLAGRKRPALRDEWKAHLAGESGYDPVTWPKVRQALGFVASAVQCRLADAAAMAWRPVDAVLGSRFLSNLFVWGPVVAMLVAIVHHDGRFGLVADVQDPVALGAFLYGAIRTGRWWRGVKPPEPKARTRVKE